MDHLNKIVDHLLGYARSTEPTFELVDVNELLDDVLLLTRQKLRHQKIELVRKFGEGLPKVRADRGQIEQACLNLILNAADAMSGGREAHRLVGDSSRTIDDGGAVVHGYGHGHGAGKTEAALRAVPHHESARHRPRPGHRPEDRRGPPRENRSRKQAEEGDDVPHPAAGREAPWRSSRHRSCRDEHRAVCSPYYVGRSTLLGAADFSDKLLQQRFELGIRRRAEVERLLVVIARQFHVGRALFGVDDGQVEMRVGVLRVDLDRAANFLFAGGRPAFLAEHDAEVVVRFGVVRIERHGAVSIR